MKNLRWIAPLAVLALALCPLTGCETSRLKVETLNPTVDPADQIKLLETDLAKARSGEIHLLSPAWFAAAEASLKEAEKGWGTGESPSETLLKVSRGRSQLERAEKTARQTSILLADAIHARALAREAGAMSLGEDYKDLDERFFQLVKEAEDNETEWVRKHSPKVVADYLKIELRAIKDSTLGPGWKLMRQAEKEDAHKILPRTFAAVRKRLGEAEVYVAEHRHEKEKLQATSAEAVFQTERLLQLTRQAKEVREMKPEEIVLRIEAILQEAARELGAADMRDKVFSVQEENVLNAIGSLKEDNKVLSDRVGSRETLQRRGQGPSYGTDGNGEGRPEEIVVKEVTH